MLHLILCGFDLPVLNQAELMALNTGLREACRLNLHGILVKGDSFCVCRWASSQSTAPWYLANIMEQVLDLATRLGASFLHVKWSANTEADRQAKEGIHHPNLVLFYSYADM